MTAVIIIGGIILLAIIIVAAIYNSLVTLRNRYKNSFSQIDVQLKRRYDLIPNLVETAKGYMKHERETLEAVINARNSALSASQKASGNPGDPAAMKDLAGAEALLTGTLGRLFALAENYPDLKANENMLQLKFPHTIIAGMFKFSPAQLLESTEAPEERKAPKVSF
ncbi:MAG: LemA family protein [Desulfobacterales bacterium]